MHPSRKEITHMGRRCITCQHKKYREINRLLVERRIPLSSISKRYGISTDALRNHQHNCIHLNLRRAQEQRDQDYAEELWGVFTKSVSRLSTNIDDLEDVIAQTKKRKHYGTLIKALGETRSTLELAYKMMVSISATQRAEQDIEWLFHDERLGEILHDLQTDELKVFRKVLSKLVDRTSVPMVEIQSGGVMDVRGGGALDQDIDDLEDEDGYESLMIRTKPPRDRGVDIDQNNVTEQPVTDHSDPQSNGGEDQDELDPAKPHPPKGKWRPKGVPISMIHFESGQAFHEHVYRGKGKWK
jgi:hypothetical protein